MKSFTCALLIPILLASAQVSHAEDAAVYLTAGQSAPFAGYLITQQKADKIRLMDIDLKACLKEADLSAEQEKIQNDRLSLANTQIKDLNSQIQAAKGDGFLTKAGYFLFGAAAATLVAYGASRAVR